MKNQLCVSSYSLRGELGPIQITYRGPDGKPVSIAWGETPARITLLDLPRLVMENLGFDAIEICQFHIPERTPGYLERLRQALTDAGVSLVNVPIDVGNISDANDAYRAEDLAEIEEWMSAAAFLGARMVRVNASMPLAQGPLAALEVTIDSYRRLARTAESLGLTLLIENHGGITRDPETIVRIVEAVGPEHLKTLVDVGNFDPVMSAAHAAMMEGKEPGEVDATPLFAAIARIAPYAGFVHAKSLGFHADGRPIIWDVERALRVVRDSGYTGPISIEYEGAVDDPWENVRRTRRLVDAAFA